MVFTDLQKKELNVQLHDEISDAHETYDKFTLDRLFSDFMESIDKKGFVFDFNNIWHAVGYKNKFNAKRLLIGTRGKLGMKEGKDYKIFSESSNIESDEKKIKNNSKGRHQEKIMITSRCLTHFALSAKTEEGQFIRDAVLYMLRIFKDFQNKMMKGDISIVNNRKDMAKVRKLLCESDKNFKYAVNNLYRAVCHKKMCNFESYQAEMNECLIASNLAITQQVTGLTKNKISELLGKRFEETNCRDYMTKNQCRAVIFALDFTVKKINEAIHYAETKDVSFRRAKSYPLKYVERYIQEVVDCMKKMEMIKDKEISYEQMTIDQARNILYKRPYENQQ